MGGCSGLHLQRRWGRFGWIPQALQLPLSSPPWSLRPPDSRLPQIHGIFDMGAPPYPALIHETTLFASWLWYHYIAPSMILLSQLLSPLSYSPPVENPLQREPRPHLPGLFGAWKQQSQSTTETTLMLSAESTNGRLCRWSWLSARLRDVWLTVDTLHQFPWQYKPSPGIISSWRLLASVRIMVEPLLSPYPESSFSRPLSSALSTTLQQLSKVPTRAWPVCTRGW